MKWEISKSFKEYIVVQADSFDEAIAKARKIDPDFDTGQVVDDRKEENEMKAFKIKVQNTFGKYTVCEWEAESAEAAVAEFLEYNPAYANKGMIVAE